MFNLPMINPENVSRDFIDVFGGYNHNLRIGDNEFYDMKNMSSSCYPLLATRPKRGSVPASAVDKDKVVGMIYRSAFYYVTAVYGLHNKYVEPLTLHKLDGDTHTVIKQFDLEDCVSSKQKKLIMMGAYMLIFPDKVYVNVENPEDYGNIDAEVKTTGDTVSIKPCFSDGIPFDIDYCGAAPPAIVQDGYVWLDTSSDPAAMKRYDAKSGVWISALFQYIRLTAENTDISSVFSEGDGVMISGAPMDLDGVSIIRQIPEDDNHHSLVFSGQFETTGDIQVFEPIETLRAKKTLLRVFCSSSVESNQFKDQRFIVGDKKVVCSRNTPASSYEYWIDRNMYLIPSQEEMRTVDRKQIVTIPNGVIEIQPPTTGGIFDTIAAQENVYIRVGKTGAVFQYIHDSSTQENNTIQLKPITNSNIYRYDEKDLTIPSGAVLYPVERGDSMGLYETSLTFADIVDIDSKFCLDPQFGVEHTGEIIISRKAPEMDFIIESNNRLWGCYYGKDENNQFLNEVYCSKLNDFKNWRCYEGISTDSYTASCGLDGPWTGAICYLGHPVFFKENYIQTVYGSYPAQFSINSVTARGVQHGSEKSLAILNEVLYYMSPEGVCQYNGSLPTNISYNFGDLRYSEAVACAFNGKYYIKMLDKNDDPVFMVYDSTRNLWHKEDNVDIRELCPVADDIYYVFEDWELRSLFGGQDPDPIEWYAETGIYGLSQTDSKYISRLNVRMALDIGSTVILSIQYDSSGVWEKLCAVARRNINPFTLPIKPRRCDHFRLRLEGKGGAKIYSISKTVEQGSDTV